MEAQADLFIDTGAFLARYDRSDQYHAQASAAWARLAPPQTRWRLVTSGGVLSETCTLLGRRAGYPLAANIAHSLLNSPSLRILWPDAACAAQAQAWFARCADQAISWCDCESFALMRQHSISEVFTFDRHFLLAGSTVWPH